MKIKTVIKTGTVEEEVISVMKNIMDITKNDTVTYAQIKYYFPIERHYSIYRTVNRLKEKEVIKNISYGVYSFMEEE